MLRTLGQSRSSSVPGRWVKQVVDQRGESRGNQSVMYKVAMKARTTKLVTGPSADDNPANIC